MVTQGRILWKLGRVEEAESKLQRRPGEAPFSIALNEEQQLLWDQFAEVVTKKMGEFEGRNWLYKLHIPAREEGLSKHLVDLSKHYNASLEESWYSPLGYPNYSGPFFNEFQTGVQTFDGTPYDIRGLVQLNDRTAIDMLHLPQRVNAIEVGVEGNRFIFSGGRQRG